jgi:hypothetical protein
LNTVKINSPEHFLSSFEGFFFNEDVYVNKQQGGKRHVFELVDPSGKSLARFVLFVVAEAGLSPLRAPFGSVEFEKDLASSEVEKLIKAVDDFAETNKLNNIRIVSYPDCYSPTNASLLKSCLLNNEYKIMVEDHNFHIQVEGKAFEDGLHDSEKRRLKKSLNAGFRSYIENTDDVRAIHQLISKCRDHKGHPLSMNLEDFEKMLRDFPDKYLLFTLRDREKLIAAAVGVKINSSILYNFLPADDIEYKNFSPMVMLMKEMYDYCKRSGYKIFDLGIATSNGIPNSGLLKFKEHLGGEFSYKFTFEKKFLK